MPKMPEGEWKEFLNPESEEYSPDIEGIKNEDRLADEIAGELSEIRKQIGKKDYDYSNWEEDKFSAQDPKFMWEDLYYLEKDISQIGDTIERERLLAQLREVEEEVYCQYIPFIDAKINIFGWQESPLEEKYGRTNFLSAEEIESYFRLARDMAAKFAKTEEEKTDYESELDRLSERLVRYKKEPTLFSFEHIQEEIYREIRFITDARFDSFSSPRPDLKAKVAFDSEETRGKNTQELKKLLKMAFRLQSIAEEMHDPEIKQASQKKALHLHDYIEHLLNEVNAPRELLEIEGLLKSIYSKLKTKIGVSPAEIQEIRERVTLLREKNLFGAEELLEKQQKLLGKIERAMKGEFVDDEDEERIISAEKGFNWYWEVLGLERTATLEEAKKAYKKLAHKFHPDKNSSPEAVERMKDINQAFDFVERFLGDTGVRIG